MTSGVCQPQTGDTMDPDNTGSDYTDETRILSLNSPAQVDDAVRKLFCHAKHCLYVRAPNLDFPFFSSKDIAPAIAPLIRGDLRNHLYILIDDEKHVLNKCGRLVELARKFSSYIKIHKLPLEYRENEELLIVADRSSYLHMASKHQFPASLGVAVPARTRQLLYRFNQLWERSEPVRELSTLGL